MAVALKVRHFRSPQALAVYCTTAGNNVTTIVSIVFDAQSNTHVLYYT